MRSARSLFLSFSGHVTETVSFRHEDHVIRKNLNAFRTLVSAMGPSKDIPDRQRIVTTDRWLGRFWEFVPHSHVTDFLAAYETHPDSPKANSKVLEAFIASMARTGELTTWSVAFIGGSSSTEETIDGHAVRRVRRSKKTDTGKTDRWSIGRLLGSKDEGIDLDLSAWTAALNETRRLWRDFADDTNPTSEPVVPSGPAMRKVRGFGAPGVTAHPERGLLLIYLLEPFEEGTAEIMDPIVAFGISFPGSDSGTKVEYKVNNVLWEQEYAAAD